MGARDAVMVGALGAVIIVIRFALMIVGGLGPYVWFSSHFVDALLIGPVFMHSQAR
ncbi:MptD family putative ECF transporter S component [Thermophilibacter immobilis]|jgi:energy-coupling factor transport system substrate-specific component|uniref:MptD family putative ECF transporter S component n=1 Tax=Thermophilibacter immobilis TaxID=2779519 RepID=A0A7S7RU22_9ACTN|nr:MptD family putative ECF transporter S component [Thermophilibacter immobilis]